MMMILILHQFVNLLEIFLEKKLKSKKRKSHDFVSDRIDRLIEIFCDQINARLCDITKIIGNVFDMFEKRTIVYDALGRLGESSMS